jgi:hypothetical protein
MALCQRNEQLPLVVEKWIGLDQETRNPLLDKRGKGGLKAVEQQHQYADGNDEDLQSMSSRTNLVSTAPVIFMPVSRIPSGRSLAAEPILDGTVVGVRLDRKATAISLRKIASEQPAVRLD